MTGRDKADTVAIVVTYHPERAPLLRLLDGLASQVGQIVVVDNTGDGRVAGSLARRGRANEHCIAFAENRGVAAAHNSGIAWARERGARYVVLFDQDSEPAPDMVARLAAAADRLIEAGRRLGAVGPRYVDPRQPGLAAFSAANAEEAPPGVVPVKYVISSGCLMPLATLEATGGMNEALFIDYVDIEWGWRAQRRGYPSFGVPEAVLHHALGDAPIRAFGREFPSHPPLRHYYHFRNALWLYRQPGPATTWKLADAFRLARRYVFAALFAKPRLEHVRMMSLGVWHGLRGRLGPLETQRRD